MWKLRVIIRLHSLKYYIHKVKYSITCSLLLFVTLWYITEDQCVQIAMQNTSRIWLATSIRCSKSSWGAYIFTFPAFTVIIHLDPSYASLCNYCCFVEMKSYWIAGIIYCWAENGNKCVTIW